MAKSEAKATAAVYEAGVPAPRCYGTVEISGRIGLPLDRLDGPVLGEIVTTDGDKAMDALADLHTRIHGVAAPQFQSMLERRIGTATPRRFIGPTLQRLAQLPDGDAVLHSDLHVYNAMGDGQDGWVAIDWDRALYGPPNYGVARLLGTSLHTRHAAHSIVQRSKRGDFRCWQPGSLRTSSPNMTTCSPRTNRRFSLRGPLPILGHSDEYGRVQIVVIDYKIRVGGRLGRLQIQPLTGLVAKAIPFRRCGPRTEVFQIAGDDAASSHALRNVEEDPEIPRFRQLRPAEENPIDYQDRAVSNLDRRNCDRLVGSMIKELRPNPPAPARRQRIENEGPKRFVVEGVLVVTERSRRAVAEEASRGRIVEVINGDADNVGALRSEYFPQLISEDRLACCVYAVNRHLEDAVTAPGDGDSGHFFEQLATSCRSAHAGSSTVR